MKYRNYLIFALLSLFCRGEMFAQEINFSKETFSNANMTLPYRKATIQGYGDKASLVVYLHGGSSKGNDNEIQMQEPGINAIATWLSDNNLIKPLCSSRNALRIKHGSVLPKMF